MYSGGLIEVNDLNVSLRRPNNQKWIPDIHTINTLLSLCTGDRSRTLQVPVLRYDKCSEMAEVLPCNDTLIDLSQLPVTRIPPPGDSIHRIHLIGASWAPTWTA
jgi:hypothetical protein